MTLDELRDYGGLIYVATPYSLFHLGLGCAAYDASRHAEHLARVYDLRVYSPIVHSHELCRWGKLNPLDQEFWMRQNAPFMEACSAMVAVKMEGWQDSRGMAAEAAYFQAAGKPVVEMEYLA